MSGEPNPNPASGEQQLQAGDFAAWLVSMRAAVRGEQSANVPCGDCTACCASAQFIHIAPDETDALAHIPRAVLFPAPRAPSGHVLMGYDERGRCPMLVDGSCTIYEHRPVTCRTYDCRVFPAAGVDAEDDKPLIATQARRWVFSHPTKADVTLHDTVKATAVSLREDPQRARVVNATQLAVLAVEMQGSLPPAKH